MHPTCSLLSLHFSCPPNLLFPRYAAPPFPFQKRAGMSDINHPIDWGLIQLIWLTGRVFPDCLTSVSPTAQMGRYRDSWEPRNSTKSHHTPHDKPHTKDLLGEQKGGCLCLARNRRELNRKQGLYSLSCGGGNFSGWSFRGWKWVELYVTVCCVKKPLWWELKDAVTDGYRDKYFRSRIMLCQLNRIKDLDSSLARVIFPAMGFWPS